MKAILPHLSRGKQEEITMLEAKTYEKTFWSDSKQASEVMRRIARLKKEIEDGEMILLLWEEKDMVSLEKLLKEYEIKLFLSGPYDAGDAIFAIHSGQGGVEAMDWASMLLRMYTRFFERKTWKYTYDEYIAGEEAGVKSVTLTVSGEYVYGFLKGEAGTHRLVRQSPFNAQSLRQTSFALVEVLPVVAEVEIEIKHDDLVWDFFRSGGHGGQNVNKVSTAVRLTHVPTGIVVTSQRERQQEQNRENALKLLRSRLYMREQEKKDKTIEELKTSKMASWGTQIRSYVLHPYKLVKDLRSKYETSQADGVLDGELDQFIETYLKISHS